LERITEGQRGDAVIAPQLIERVLPSCLSRFATRYEKTLRNYAAVVTLGCALLWLRI
jgi:hypothetical protein